MYKQTYIHTYIHDWKERWGGGVAGVACMLANAASGPRVTRLVEFSPIRRCQVWAVFFNYLRIPNLWTALFSWDKSRALSLANLTGLGDIFAKLIRSPCLWLAMCACSLGCCERPRRGTRGARAAPRTPLRSSRMDYLHSIYVNFMYYRSVQTRVARFFLGTWYQNRKKCTKGTLNVPNGHKISQMSVEYSKRPLNISSF
jgi:hypothetical protein